MPRKSSSVPRRPRASKSQSGGFSATPRIISSEEKHELIRMHAAARAPQDPLQRVSLWAGVTLSVAALAFGWWLTVGQDIRQNAGEGSDEIRRAAAELDKFTEMLGSSSALDHLVPTPVSEATASSFDDLLRDNLSGSATRTRDLLSPAPDAATSSGQEAPPRVPAGLTPDE